MQNGEPRAAFEGSDQGLVQELFAARARRRPEAVAVSAADGVLSYGELERQANQLAHNLRAGGIARGSLVALCLDRSAALVVGALAVLKAGGAYVALDPGHPADRLGFMVRDCAATVILTSSSIAPRLDSGAGSMIVALDECSSKLSREPSSPPALANDAGDPAYVVYTSGSTGSPKGVVVRHGGLANLVAWHRRAFSITAADRATQIASPAFDAAVWELWPYLVSGASVHVPPEQVRADPAAIRDWLLAERITVTFLPTALAELVMTLEWPSDAPLRYLLTGGDTLNRHPPAGLPFRLINNYGPTEATVVATSGVIPPGQSGSGRPSIGRPISGVHAYVVDERLDLVPIGETGELLIGGAGVAWGYLGRDALTAEKFIPDRFSGIPGAKLYRTGDYVRERADGELEFQGRRDDQVQVHGHRVELGEIEAVLCRHPSVRSSVVMLHQQASSMTPRLIAYAVVAEPRPNPEHLRTHLAAQLPSGMLPSAFVYVEEMPLTANGKVDRSRLAAAARDAANGPVDSLRPRSEIEIALEAIVAELLALEHVGVHENFFMLGGHSLLGAQLISRISQRFGVEMTLRGLFEKPTVAEMAIEVERLLMAELDQMTDADAVRLLAAEARTNLGSDGDEQVLLAR